MADSWGWAGTVSAFIDASEASIIESLDAHHWRVMGSQPSGSQVEAWTEEISILRGSFMAIAEDRPFAAAWGLVLEYELPREGGRRPDAVLLANDAVVVLEFKSDWALQRAYLDQVDAYARDLSEYHSASHGRTVEPVLVLARGELAGATHYGVTVTNAAGLEDTLRGLLPTGDDTGRPSLDAWLQGEYAALPSLVSAARAIFRDEELPQIRRAASSGVEEAVEYLRGVAEDAASNSATHLALVAGVPGSGKTLVGLRFVYETHFASDSSQAVFLSGNGPLVQVLQHALSKDRKEGRVFVQDVHRFLKSYGGAASKIPREHSWVYDEAQRAWDIDKVRERRPDGFSEPEDFLRIGEKAEGWALMIGLIGEGQEIHVGEESGLAQWNDALKNTTKKWTVHCPPDVKSVFTNAGDLRETSDLDLTVTLRSHKAEQLHDWVASLLGGDVGRAKTLAEELKMDAFSPLVTRNEAAARSYAQTRYANAPEARYGLMMSSQRKASARYGFHDDFYLKPGPWFADGPESEASCRQLRTAVTEFQCQGLELDMPLIGWGLDLLWGSGGWIVPSGVRKRVNDPFTITKNVYRVLLTRGRDGFVVFVPPIEDLDATFEILVAGGCDRLETAVV